MQFCRLVSIDVTSCLLLRVGQCSTPRVVNNLYIFFIDRVLESIHTYIRNTYILTYLLTYSLTYLLNYSMEHSTSWEANRFSASQEIPRILCKPKVHYRSHKCPPPVPILSQLEPVHTPTSHFLRIHLNIILPSTTGSPKWSLSLSFPPIRATCPAHLIPFDFITRTVLGEEYRSLSSSLCSFLHFPDTSSLLGPNILLSILFSNTLSLRSSLSVSDQVLESMWNESSLRTA